MDGDIFYTDGTPLVIEGLDAAITTNSADDVGFAWAGKYEMAPFRINSGIEMSDDGYADLARKLEKFLAPSEVIVKCSYCRQWAAVKTSCRHCGAAVG